MLKIFLCDDDPQFLSSLASKIKELLPNSTVHEFVGGKGLSSALFRTSCDLLLLDIDMPGLNGLEIAEMLTQETDLKNQAPLLVFVTSHDELVYDSFKFHPFGFVRKGHLDAELSPLLRDCEHELNLRKRFFCFQALQASGSKVKLPLCEILYFESEANYVRLFADSGEYRFRGTLGAIEKELSENGFVRIHKGFLVNQSAVRRLSSDEAELRNGEKIPIGRTYGENSRRLLMRYMMK